jgi:hypothetical protein
VQGSRPNDGGALAAGANHLTIGGSDGTNLRPFAVDASGIQRVINDKIVDIALSANLTAGQNVVESTALNGAKVAILELVGGTTGTLAFQVRNNAASAWTTLIGSTANEVLNRVGQFSGNTAPAIIFNVSGFKFFRIVIVTTLGASLASSSLTLSYSDTSLTIQGLVAVQGLAVHGATVATNLLPAGFESRSANRAQTANGQFSRPINDSLGRTIVKLNQIREMEDANFTTISTTTETTIVAALASTQNDLQGFLISNTSASATRVDIRDSTAGAIRFSFNVAGGATLFVPARAKQATQNTNWTIQLGTAVTDVRITMLTERLF